MNRSLVALALVAGLATACGSAASPSTAPVNSTAATAAPATLAPPSTPAPTPTPWPSSPGTGSQYVVGTLTGSAPTYSSSPGTDGVTYIRGGVLTGSATANDARATGTTRLAFSIDDHGTLGPEWGTMTITNDKGAWTGPCTGASWSAGELSLLTCWLSGGGAYRGYTYYLAVSSSGLVATSDGIIYLGTAPNS